MNKEAKAIVDYLEEEREAIRTLCYYPDDVLSCEDLIMLMDYINQLETNIEEVSNNIRNSRFMIGRTNERSLYATFLSKQVEILGRGKE